MAGPHERDAVRLCGYPRRHMPVDPGTRAIIDAIDQNFPRTELLSPAEARRLTKELSAPLGDPEPVLRVENRRVPGPSEDIPVRLYWPSDESPAPALAFFHGGGWVVCDLDTHDGLCRSIANSAGCVVVSVDYRLSPEAKFPAAAEDAYAATRWIHDEARALGVDEDRIGVGGDSAGGNLAAVVAMMARDRGGPPLRFQLLLYPVTNHAFDTRSYRENGEGYFLTEAAMRWYWDQYLADPADGNSPYASPLRATDLDGLPPAMVVTAEYDPLRDEGEEYGRRLTQAGVPTTIRREDGLIHGFSSFAPLLEQARIANDRAFAALGGALRG